MYSSLTLQNHLFLKKLFAVSSSYLFFHSSNLLEPYWTELETRAANSRNSQFSEGQTFKEIVAVQCDDCILQKHIQNTV